MNLSKNELKETRDSLYERIRDLQCLQNYPTSDSVDICQSALDKVLNELAVVK